MGKMDTHFLLSGVSAGKATRLNISLSLLRTLSPYCFSISFRKSRISQTGLDNCMKQSNKVQRGKMVKGI
jgi:hypothetical protein